jgi:hypothetical protein
VVDTMAKDYGRAVDQGLPGTWDSVAMSFDDDLGKDIRVVTEVSRTSNLAANFAAQTLYDFKQWNAILDGRTRPSHRAAHGQIVPVDGLFVVGTDLMDAPGDWTAEPRETQNCRCSLFFFNRGEAVSGWYRPRFD